MWWSKAAELVNAFRTASYEEEVIHEANMLPVLMRRDEVEFVRIKDGMTVKQLLGKITRKPDFALIQVKRDVFNRILGRRVLGGDEKIGELRGVNWETDRAEFCDIWLVDLSQEVTVFFNSYFRMATGTPSHLQRLYIEPGMTVGDFEEQLKQSLAIPLDDFRMGLYGFERGEVFPLDADLLMSELREREADPLNPAFFQFQIHPECECQAHLGVSRASNLIMRANRGTRKMKKCWFYLQGTSLFYRPSQKDFRWTKELERVDQCKVIYRGKGKGESWYRFDLVPLDPKLPVRVFYSPLKERIVKWVRALRESHPSLEINEPMTLDELKKVLGEQEFAKKIEASAAIQKDSVPLEHVNFYQRRLIEMAEACQQKVELDGGLLKLNGDERIEEDLARKWVETVRELLLHCTSKMQARKSAKPVLELVKEVLRKLRPWIEHLENANGEEEAEEEMSALLQALSEVIEDGSSLVHAFRFFVINLNAGMEDEIHDQKERGRVEDTLERLQDGLTSSLLNPRKQQRPRVVMRGLFRPDVDLKKERETAKQRAKAEDEKIRRRKARSKEGSKAVWSVLSQGQSEEDQGELMREFQSNDDLAGGFDRMGEYGTRYNNISYDNLQDAEEEKAGSGWDRVRAFFQRKTTKNLYRVSYDEVEAELEEQRRDEDEEGSGLEVSLENGDRLSEDRWSEAEAMFRAYSKNRRSSAKKVVEPKPEEAEEDTVIRSGFNRFGTKPVRNNSTSLATNTWRTDAPLEESLSPIRAGPEDEALLLRMLKDPRVQGLLQEYKEARNPAVSNQPEPNSVREHRESWQRRA